MTPTLEEIFQEWDAAWTAMFETPTKETGMTKLTKYDVEIIDYFNGPVRIVTVEAESMTYARATALRETGAYATCWVTKTKETK